MNPISAHHARGLTIVEALVATTIIAVLAATALPGFADYLERKRIEALAREMAADLRSLRAQAVTNRYSYVFYPRPTCYNLQKWSGATYCPCDGSGTGICLPSGPLYAQATQDIFKNVASPSTGITFVNSANLQNGKYAVIDSQSAISGATQGAGIYTDIVGARGNQLRVKVNAAGLVSDCSPGGQFPGYPSAGC